MTWLGDGVDVSDKGERGISMVARFYWESLDGWWCCQTHEDCHLGYSTQQQNTVVIQVVSQYLLATSKEDGESTSKASSPLREIGHCYTHSLVHYVDLFAVGYI